MMLRTMLRTMLRVDARCRADEEPPPSFVADGFRWDALLFGCCAASWGAALRCCAAARSAWTRVGTRAFWAGLWKTLTVSHSAMEMDYSRLQQQVAYINDRFADKRSAQYWQGLEALAKLPHVAIKISMLCYTVRWQGRRRRCTTAAPPPPPSQ